MSYLERIDAVNTARRAQYRPLLLASGERIGRIWQHNIAPLHKAGICLQENQQNELIWQVSTDINERNTLLANAARNMLETGYISGWRDELFPIKQSYYAPVQALIERAAVPVLGVNGYGVHLNGITQRNGKAHMWIARRSKDKPVEPDKLDQIVAGGIPYQIDIFDNLIKESSEEAGIPAAVIRMSCCVGLISYTEQVNNGIRADVIFNYDLQLPPDFIPQNQDGEVSEFICLSIAEVAELVETSDIFKANAALVIIDYLVRHGYITPKHPDYEAICLRMRQHF